MKRGRKKNDDLTTVSLHVSLEFNNSNNNNNKDLTQLQFHSVLLSALERLHGQVGACSGLRLSEYTNCSCRVDVLQKDVKTVWSALSLFGYYEGERCAFRITWWINDNHDNDSNNNSHNIYNSNSNHNNNNRNLAK